ncbi:MAG: DUF3078 domain-containing protein [Paludibacteraceae bacterium]
MSLSDGYAGVAPDTIRLQDLPAAADMDAILLELVAQQSRMLHDSDTVALMTVAEVLLRDSLAREQQEIDSLKRENANLHEEVNRVPPVMIVERSLIRDTEEDRLAAMRAIRDMYSPWRKEAKIIAQLTQNYVSPNWYQGGASSFAMLSIVKGTIGYYSDRFTWENTGEWRAGFTTVSNDSLHKVNTTDDLFRIYTKANYKAMSKLFYSFSAEFETRLFPTYRSNSSERKSGPFSPLRLNLALGLDYKPVDGLSLSFSPLAYKLVYVADTVRVQQTEFSVPVGHKTLNDVGSSIRVEYVWKPVREVVLETKFYLYTNYKRVELDLEVNCDFIINRFFSARLMLHPRYDNTVIYTGDERAKLQFRELLSIGFAHKFR